MRLFTAIDLAPDVRRHLGRLLERFRPLAPLSWTTPDRMHITTKFIGEWPEERLEEIKRTLASVGSPGQIEIAIREVGWFPNALRPRVFWAGVEGGRPLQDLAQATEEAVARIGVEREPRDYSPHLTLARIRERVPLDALRREIDALESTEFGSFTVPCYCLYLSRAGKYTKLAEYSIT